MRRWSATDHTICCQIEKARKKSSALFPYEHLTLCHFSRHIPEGEAELRVKGLSVSGDLGCDLDISLHGIGIGADLVAGLGDTFGF